MRAAPQEGFQLDIRIGDEDIDVGPIHPIVVIQMHHDGFRSDRRSLIPAGRFGYQIIVLVVGIAMNFGITEFRLPRELRHIRIPVPYCVGVWCVCRCVWCV